MSIFRLQIKNVFKYAQTLCLKCNKILLAELNERFQKYLN